MRPEHDRADVALARTAWHAAAPTLDPARLVFLDERGVRTDLIRRYGRGLYGARVPDHTPDGRWHTTTFLAALRLGGLTAPAVFDGPIDGASFPAYSEQVLVPTCAARLKTSVRTSGLSRHTVPISIRLNWRLRS